MTTVYVIDTSSLILLNRSYTRTTFPTVWNNMDGLVNQNRLISHMEVYSETQKMNDDLTRWCKSNRSMFVPNDQNILTKVGDIMRVFPPLVNVSLPSTTAADPFLIALASIRNSNPLITDTTIVITEERLSKKIRIPYVCSHYGIQCTNLLGLFEKESWKF